MTRVRIVLLLPCAALVVACSTLSDDPGLLPLAGCWSAFNNVPGSSLVLQLTEGQTTIDGTGTFRLEAGPSGNLTVTGTRTGAKFDVELFYDIGTHRSFLGIIRSKEQFDAYFRDDLQHLATTPTPFERCN